MSCLWLVGAQVGESNQQATASNDASMWGTKGDAIKVQNARAGWGKGWIRTEVGIEEGALKRWRVRLSKEDGGKVHVVGVVSEGHSQWDAYEVSGNSCQTWWVAQNDAVWSCGTKVDGYEGIFKEGDTVNLALDRQAHTLTIVGSKRTVMIRDLPPTGPLYPVLAFCSNKQYAELLDYEDKKELDATKRGPGAETPTASETETPTALASAVSPFHGDALPSPTGEGFQKALLVKHVALVKRGKGLSDEEADVELKHAREGGALSAELYDLLLIHHLYEEFASLTTGTIMLEGLILLVMNMFKAHQGQMNDDIIRHHALLLAREFQGDNAGRRAACRQEDGVSFDQFLAYAVSNLHVLEPLLQQTRSRFSSQQVHSEPCPRSYSFSPCFKAVVWVSDDPGKVEDIVDVKEGPCLEGSYRAVLESDPKATWLARCAAAATDALACMLRGDNGLPSMITLDLPATSQEAQAEADVSSAPNSDDTEFVKLVEYVVGRLKNPENEPPRSPAHTLVGIRLKELHKLLNKLPQGWTLKDARAQPEKLKEMCGSAAPAAHSMNHVVPDGVRYSIHASDTFKVGEKCVIKRTDGQ